ncbi:MAG: hypothetical protein ACHQ06_05455 [Candidatus Dormibacteria bacterium]|jgi:hypothetical protein
MRQIMLKVIVSRPEAVPAEPPAELRRRDFCWTTTGEILVPPAVPCADVDTCGCGWAFAGITSARATTWGRVEARSLAQITTAIRRGRHLAGSADYFDGFYDHILNDVRVISDRVRRLPIGALVGIWTVDEQRFSLFDRTPRREPARPVRSR